MAHRYRSGWDEVTSHVAPRRSLAEDSDTSVRSARPMRVAHDDPEPESLPETSSTPHLTLEPSTSTVQSNRWHRRLKRVDHAHPYRPSRAQGHAPKPRPVKKLLLVGTSVVGLVLVVGLVMQSFWGIAGNKPWVSMKPVIPAAQGAATAVENYLGALARGDAKAALALGKEQPSDASWATDEVLKSAIAINPITGISQIKAEGVGSDAHQLISAHYRIGQKEVVGWFDMVLADDQWLLPQATAIVNLQSVNPLQVGLKINGFPLTSDEVALFPGSYELTIDNKWLELSNDHILVDAPIAGQGFFTTAPILTKVGSQAVVKAAEQQLSKCIKSQKSAPELCGFGVRIDSKSPLVKRTVTWTVTRGANELKNLKPTLVVGNPMQTTNYVTIELRFKGVDEDDYPWVGTGTIRAVLADLRQDTVQVVFT